MLTDSQTVEFLKMIKSGNNTYGKLQERFPLDHRDWSLYIDNDFDVNPVNNKYKIGIIEFVAAPRPYFREYQFKNDDAFKLTVAGQNILDRDKKECRNLYLSVIAAVGGLIALIEFLAKLIRL